MSGMVKVTMSGMVKVTMSGMVKVTMSGTGELTTNGTSKQSPRSDTETVLLPTPQTIGYNTRAQDCKH